MFGSVIQHFARRGVSTSTGSMNRRSGAVRSPFFVRLVLPVSLFALVCFLGSGLVLWQRARGSLNGCLERMERDVSRRLAGLSTASESSFPECASDNGEVIKRWRVRFAAFKRMDPSQADKVFALYRVDDQIARWKSLVVGSGLPDELPFANRWTTVQNEIRQERAKWPVYAPEAGVRIPAELKVFRDGLWDGFRWPYAMVLRARNLQSMPLGRSAPGPAACLRYLVFPYRIGSLPVPWVLGYGGMDVLAGYGLCWLGMRSKKPSLSTLGLVYLLHALTFATLLGFLIGGIIA